MASKSSETEIALQKLAYTEKQAAEIERQRKLLDAAKDTAVELAMVVRSEYLSELTRLRKIEAAARAYVVALGLEQQLGTYESDARRRDAMQELRQSLETETDG